MKVSIVIPVYNSEGTIGELCKTLIALSSQHYELEIVLVNDFSTDGSDAVCRALHTEHGTTITYIKLARNYGEHNAVMAGLNNARGDYVVIMDDDLQNPPGEVSKLLGEIGKGYDVVYSSYVEKKDSFFRNLGSWANDFMARIALKKPSSLYLSSFKVINRFLLEEIIKHEGSAPYIDAIILRTTANIGTIQVQHERRRVSHSQYTFNKLFALWGNMIVSYSLIPLRLIGFLGFVMTVVGVYYGGRTVIDVLLPGGHDPSEYDRLTAATMFFRGFQLLATSVVGEYVGRNYLYIHRDPQFVIREILRANVKRDTLDRRHTEAKT